MFAGRARKNDGVLALVLFWGVSSAVPVARPPLARTGPRRCSSPGSSRPAQPWDGLKATPSWMQTDETRIHVLTTEFQQTLHQQCNAFVFQPLLVCKFPPEFLMFLHVCSWLVQERDDSALLPLAKRFIIFMSSEASVYRPRAAMALHLPSCISKTSNTRARPCRSRATRKTSIGIDILPPEY